MFKLSIKNMIGLLSMVVALELAIGTGQLKVTDNMFPAAWIPAIKDWAAALAIVGSAMVGYISRSLPDTPDVAKPSMPAGAGAAAMVALVIGLTLAFGGGDAFAQSKPGLIQSAAQRNDVNAPGGTPAAVASGPIKILTPNDLLQKLVQVNLADLTYAQAQAKAAGNKVTEPCWGAWVNLIATAQQPLKDASGNILVKPDPHLFTDLESASELLQALQPGGSIQVGCGPMADATKKSTMQIASAIVSGGGIASLLPLPVGPPIP